MIFAISSVTQLCPTLCDPMNHNTLGLPIHHQFQESTQTHVHWVSDHPTSHPLSSLSPLSFNLSQHQGLFKRVSSSLCVYIQFSQQPFTSYSLEIKAHRGSPTCPKLDSEWRKQHFHPCDLAPVCAVNHCTPKILKIKMLPQQCLNSRAPSIIPKWLPFSSFTE